MSSKHEITIRGNGSVKILDPKIGRPVTVHNHSPGEISVGIETRESCAGAQLKPRRLPAVRNLAIALLHQARLNGFRANREFRDFLEAAVWAWWPEYKETLIWGKDQGSPRNKSVWRALIADKMIQYSPARDVWEIGAAITGREGRRRFEMLRKDMKTQVEAGVAKLQDLFFPEFQIAA